MKMTTGFAISHFYWKCIFNSNAKHGIDSSMNLVYYGMKQGLCLSAAFLSPTYLFCTEVQL